jgi:hypothetical protein
MSVPIILTDSPVVRDVANGISIKAAFDIKEHTHHRLPGHESCQTKREMAKVVFINHVDSFVGTALGKVRMKGIINLGDGKKLLLCSCCCGPFFVQISETVWYCLFANRQACRRVCNPSGSVIHLCLLQNLSLF